jgi:cytochrome c553
VRTQNKKGTMRKVPASVCARCHGPESSPEPFDFATANKLTLGPGHGG